MQEIPEGAREIAEAIKEIRRFTGTYSELRNSLILRLLSLHKGDFAETSRTAKRLGVGNIVNNNLVKIRKTKKNGFVQPKRMLLASPIETDKTKAITLGHELTKLKSLHGEKNFERRKKILLALLETCQWDTKAAQEFAAIGLSALANQFKLGEYILKQRRLQKSKKALYIGKTDESISSFGQLAERIGINIRNFAHNSRKGTRKKLASVFSARRRKRSEQEKKKKADAIEEEIIASYGNLSAAESHMKTKKRRVNKDLWEREVNVGTAVETGRQKLKNDLMFVLKMTGNDAGKTAEIFGVTPRAIRNWKKWLKITRESIEVYHTPFAVVPTGKVVDHTPDVIGIKNGRFFLRNWDSLINSRIVKAREALNLAHPDHGGSPEKLRQALNNLKRIKELDGKIRLQFNLPQRKQDGIIRIQRAGTPRSRWDVIKFRKIRFPQMKRK